jgi:hypothetical protein
VAPRRIRRRRETVPKYDAEEERRLDRDDVRFREVNNEDDREKGEYR